MIKSVIYLLGNYRKPKQPEAIIKIKIGNRCAGTGCLKLQGTYNSKNSSSAILFQHKRALSAN
jgi:hypothetical protein